MTTLTLFEHEQQPFEWHDAHFRLLDQVNRSSRTELLRFGVHRGQKVVIASHHVGVAKIGSLTVQVLPKLYRSVDNESRQIESTRNLLHMLAYASEVPIHEEQVSPLIYRQMNWLEILTRIFAVQMLKEWQKGPQRSYQELDRTMPVVRGRWRVSDQLRHPEQQHLLYVTYDEFSEDNALNRVFRYVLRRLLLIGSNPENRRLLRIAEAWLDGVELSSSLGIRDAAKVRITRISERFRPLLNLAKLFLGGSGLQLGAGSLETYSFMFDMNRLFEAFLIQLISKHREDVLPSSMRNARLLPQAQGVSYFLSRRSDGERVFKLRPDLVVEQGAAHLLIVDAKYKVLRKEIRDAGVSEGDMYQMLAYATRLDANDIVLVYPSMGQSIWNYFDVMNTQRRVWIRTLDISVDLSSSEGRKQIIGELRKALEVKRV